MLNNIPYLEMNGLGNKFIMINKSNISVDIDLSRLAKSLADSLEFDQMILYEKFEKYTKMFVYNKDGSSAGMCANASRCLMKLMHDENRLDSIMLKVGGKVLQCNYESDKKITIDMGQANFKPDWQPKDLSKAKKLLETKKIEMDFIGVADVGNPHIIILLKHSIAKDIMEKIGQAFQTDDYFPGGINVNFAHIKDGDINLIVYERGAGFTEACGSGATATYAALFKEHLIEDSSFVHFEKGELLMKASEAGISLTGQAEKTGEAEFQYIESLESPDP